MLIVIKDMPAPYEFLKGKVGYIEWAWGMTVWVKVPYVYRVCALPDYGIKLKWSELRKTNVLRYYFGILCQMISYYFFMLHNFISQKVCNGSY